MRISQMWTPTLRTITPSKYMSYGTSDIFSDGDSVAVADLGVSVP